MSLERGTNLEVLPVDNAPSISIGTVTTLAAGNPATVTNVGSAQNALLNFAIPQGAQGLQGVQGNAGTNGTNGTSPNITIGSVTTLSSGSSATATLTGTFPNLSLNLGIPMGATGSGSSVAWGGITGTLSNQTDLQSALSGKAASSHSHAQSDVTGLAATLATLAPLASPTFTGTPTAPSPAAADNSQKLATTGWVNQAIAAYDMTLAGFYAPLSSPGFTGSPTINGILAGYRNLPTSRTLNANDTLADADKGKKIIWTGGVGTITINPNSATPIDSDAIGTVVNNGSGNLTLARGAGVTAKLIGTGGNADRVVPIGCIATWLKIGTDTFFVGGANVA